MTTGAGSGPDRHVAFGSSPQALAMTAQGLALWAMAWLPLELSGFRESLYQPGVASIVDYLNSLSYHPAAKCLPGYYDMVDNQNRPCTGTAARLTTGGTIARPPATPTIADVMLAEGISWSYFGEGWHAYLANWQSPPRRRNRRRFSSPSMKVGGIMIVIRFSCSTSSATSRAFR